MGHNKSRYLEDKMFHAVAQVFLKSSLLKFAQYIMHSNFFT